MDKLNEAINELVDNFRMEWKIGQVVLVNSSGSSTVPAVYRYITSDLIECYPNGDLSIKLILSSMYLVNNNPQK